MFNLLNLFHISGANVARKCCECYVACYHWVEHYHGFVQVYVETHALKHLFDVFLLYIAYAVSIEVVKLLTEHLHLLAVQLAVHLVVNFFILLLICLKVLFL